MVLSILRRLITKSPNPWEGVDGRYLEFFQSQIKSAAKKLSTPEKKITSCFNSLEARAELIGPDNSLVAWIRVTGSECHANMVTIRTHLPGSEDLLRSIFPGLDVRILERNSWDDCEGTMVSRYRKQLEAVASELSHEGTEIKTRFVEDPCGAEFYEVKNDNVVLAQVRLHGEFRDPYEAFIRGPLAVSEESQGVFKKHIPNLSLLFRTELVS